jgi:hypothetical protein
MNLLLIALGLGFLAMAGGSSRSGGGSGVGYDPLSGGSGGGALEDDESGEDMEEVDPFFEPQGPSTLPDYQPDLDPDLWDVDRILPGVGTPPDPLIVGFPDEPEVAVALDELNQFLQEFGVDKYTDARELCEMPKAPGRPVAVPDYSLWENIIPTLEIFQAIREALDVPLSVRAYRPVDYNAAVGGSTGSTHQWFAAVDIRIVTDYSTGALRQELGRLGAEFYKDYGSQYKIGFGAYGAPIPGNIHIDTGWKRRTWDDASFYVDQV